MQVDIVSGALASAHTPLVLLCAGLWLRESRPKGVLVSVQLFYLAPKALKAHSMTTKHLPPLRTCSQSKAGEANPVTQTTANCHLLGNDKDTCIVQPGDTARVLALRAVPLLLAAAAAAVSFPAYAWQAAVVGLCALSPLPDAVSALLLSTADSLESTQI